MARARSSASRSTPFRQAQSRRASTMPTSQTSAPSPPPAPVQQYPAAMAQTAPRQPGLFGQMAATAAGVAVGHSVGHAVTSAFGMGSSPHQQAPVETQQPIQQQYSAPVTSCDENAKAFTKCLDATNNDMSVCQYYLEQLKACQAFAAQQNL
ncbi:Coiled-coil-helix-coiled-coil-helix domain-containing protein 2 [Linnemannia zychae]|nr:Coiled-coil-helix-coiled-coil-helix domain-containing protein 2 [Linnemannia zychae]